MKNSLKFVLAAATGLASVQSMAAGFEKNTMWSGRYMGRAGAAVSSVDGSEALYFNPARMINAQAPQSVNFSLSPTMSYYKAPIATSAAGGESDVIKSENKTSLPGALIYSNKLNEDWAFGAGIYAAGGSDVEYKSVQSAVNAAYRGNVKTDLKIYEASIGGAYRINEMLSVGLAWRVSMVDAAFSMLKSVPSANASAQTDFTGLKATEYSGVRLGINFTPSETWGLGISYRSNVDFDAKGKSNQTFYSNSTGAVFNPGGTGARTRSDDSATLKSSLPQQLNIGGHYKINDTWTGFAEYSWTNYAKVKSLQIDATGVNPTTNGASAIPNVTTNWKDQSVVRLAAEYTGMIVPIRFGYAYTSQVTPNATAAPALATPGVAHTFAVGTTYEMSESLRLDGALEYTQVNGKVATSDQSTSATGAKEPAAGSYSSAAVPAVHLGATYFF